MVSFKTHAPSHSSLYSRAWPCVGQRALHASSSSSRTGLSLCLHGASCGCALIPHANISLTDSLFAMLTMLVCILAKFLCAARLTSSTGLIFQSNLYLARLFTLWRWSFLTDSSRPEVLEADFSVELYLSLTLNDRTLDLKCMLTIQQCQVNTADCRFISANWYSLGL